MKILQVNISDTKGGACVISWNLHQAFQKVGYESVIAVKYKFSNDNAVQIIDNDKTNSLWITAFARIADWIDTRNFFLSHKIAALFRYVAAPARDARKRLGIEEFNYPASSSLNIEDVDIIHCHILHGGFFDLRNLREWSREKPVIVTMHDAWLLAGHCAHSFECERWLIGCGSCPDITIPVAIEKDNSALNWKRKKEIFDQSHLYIAAPCQWLMNKAEKSILKAGMRMRKVIPHGVDQLVFKKGDRKAARAAMNINQDALVLLFSANGIRRSRWKDFELMKKALEVMAKSVTDRKIIFLALGETAPNEINGNVEIHFMPFRSKREEVAMIYQASDVYLHGAKAETFPNAILEALSCGIPVVATAVGGIPEQVNGLRTFGHTEINSFDMEHATGILTPSGDAVAFASAIEYLAYNEDIRMQLAQNAGVDANTRFNVSLQIGSYLDWYKEVVMNYKLLKN